ncbi:MBL fold metallo-hydrolase [Xaviernesmea oryzae]|uniref:MBL fold metallo-hydrolase n=1 Tax=Xaviernesmea oryzae TaxID=464029 RepID=A0A1Q9ARQ4_9HYPH|nr:MBL fold metallo-hydrolase [Xaviernesmea oryzae]OLP58068.1 MBL fold metallo-hydrolase [Xaviernesmea oryzae]SEL83793.1 Glyoxylase, beta-lactamase superfamily II [Xaviernesmea oryzae]
MTDRFALGRRTLIGAAATALAAPALLVRTAQAAGEDIRKTAMSTEKDMPVPTRSLTLGDLKITVIQDGLRPSDKPEQTFGINQPPQAVADLLTENFLPSDRFANGFSPVLIETGNELVLVDTGMGEGGRANGLGRLEAGMAALGYTPEQVTLVVLTHLHGDHIGGLMAGGKPAFPKARYVIGQVEYDFWTNEARVGTPAEGGHQAVLKNVKPLAEKASFIGDGATVLPGMTAMAAFGHSPGHLTFRLESAGKALILTGDTANHYVLSLQRPDWEVRFDMDKAKAAVSRRKVFDMIASERLPFIGYHMPFPSVGYAEKAGEGYRFVPHSYQLDL